MSKAENMEILVDELEDDAKKFNNNEKEKTDFESRIAKYAHEMDVNPNVLLHEYAQLENEHRAENPDIPNDEYEKENVLLERSFIKNIKSNRLNEELKKNNEIDTKTGAYNYKAFSTRVNEIEKAKSDHNFKKRKEDKENSEHYIIMIDIDHFKNFNDTQGHQCGDYVLKELATLFGSSLRKKDMLARYGGEEFVVVTESNEEDAKNLAERLRKLLETHNFTFNEQKLNITASFGISPWNETGDNTVALADKALYEAKEKGRNAVYYNTGTEIKKFKTEETRFKPYCTTPFNVV